MTEEESFAYLCKKVRENELASKADAVRINNTMGKMAHYLSTHESICVSVSGGSDSDVIVHIIATYFREYLLKIHFVFANTKRMKLVILNTTKLPQGTNKSRIPTTTSSSAKARRNWRGGWNRTRITRMAICRGSTG